MNRVVAVLLVLPTLLAGVALFLALMALSSGSEKGPEGEAAHDDLAERVTALDAQVRSLQRELSALQAATNLQVSPLLPVTSSELQDFAAASDAAGELARRLIAMELAASSDLPANGEEVLPMSPLEKQRIRRELAEIRNEELQREIREWAKREDQKTRRRVSELTDRWSLTRFQEEEMLRILTEENANRRILLTDFWTTGEDNESQDATSDTGGSIQEKMTQMRQDRDQKLARLLTPSQFDKWLSEEQKK